MTYIEALLKFTPGTRIKYGYETGLIHTDATVIEVDPHSPPNVAILVIRYDKDPYHPGPSRVNPDYYAVINDDE
jgi:hypothetical protein